MGIGYWVLGIRPATQHCAHYVSLAPGAQRNTVSVRAVGDGLQIGLSTLRGSVPNAVTGDLALDGRQTLLAIQPEHTEELPIILIANWPEVPQDR